MDLLLAVLRLLFSPRPQPVPLPPPPDDGAPADADRNLIAWDLTQRHNAERARAGLSSLAHDARLTAVARRHADEMARRNLLTHDRESGTPYYEEIDRAVGVRVACAENIAAGPRTTGQAVAGWMASPGHRANILGPYDAMGGASAVSASGVDYWTCCFARLAG